jgi:hypothetical protein
MEMGNAREVLYTSFLQSRAVPEVKDEWIKMKGLYHEMDENVE